MRPIYCTKGGRLLVQNLADLLNQKRPPSGTNSATLLHKIRPLDCTKTGRFLCNKAAAFWYKIQPLSGTTFGRLLVQKPADLLNQKRPPSGTNSAALLHKIRLLACTKTGRFIELKAAMRLCFVDLRHKL